MNNNKINAEHLARRACVYIRQSTPDQVKYNLESKRRQYGLADRARALGWQDVDVIDDDLGVSGDGTPRSGFERLLRAVCDGQVGAVFSIEASRLARNGREWHTLLEFCGKPMKQQARNRVSSPRSVKALSPMPVCFRPAHPMCDHDQQSC
jgi:hypothetical protein